MSVCWSLCVMFICVICVSLGMYVCAGMYVWYLSVDDKSEQPCKLSVIPYINLTARSFWYSGSKGWQI